MRLRLSCFLSSRSILPTKLQTALAGQGVLADADTGLIHQGGGRFYDPTLGRPLQPNAFGGLPTVPQSLNRYGATSLGAPGVAEGVSGSGCLGNGFCRTLANTVVGNQASEYSNKFIKAVGLSRFGRTYYQSRVSPVSVYSIEVTWPWASSDPRLLGTDFVNTGGNEYRRLSSNWVVNLDEVQAIFEEFGEAGEGSLTLRGNGSLPLVTGRKFAPAVGTQLARYGLDNIFPFGVDIGFQLYQDWNNPRLTTGRRIARAGVTAGVGAFSGYAVGLVITPEFTIPYLLAGTFVGLVFDAPATNFIFETIPGFGEIPRNLRRLE